jgi:predicted nuclease of predicted toxin-antitoxin system
VKLLIDENLPSGLAHTAQARFPGSAHVSSVGLIHADDRAVFEFARREGFTIVTRDNDFDRLSDLHGAPPKVVLLKVGNARVRQLRQLIVDRADDVASFIENDEEPLLRLGPGTLPQSR